MEHWWHGSPPGSPGTRLVVLRVADDDLAELGPAPAQALVDFRDTCLVDGSCYLVRAVGRGWFRRFRAEGCRFVADQPDRPAFDESCDIVGRVIYVVRDL